MKKTYEKPGMYIENFSLSQSIAQHCGVDPANGNTLGTPGHADKSTCGWDMGGGLIIWVQGTTCNKYKDPDIPSNGMCYNNPEGAAAIFAS